MSSTNHLNKLNKRLQLQTGLSLGSTSVQKHQFLPVTCTDCSYSHVTKASVTKEDTEISEDVKSRDTKKKKKKPNLHSLVLSVTLVEAVQQENLQHHASPMV